MKKRMLAAVLAAVMVLGVSACGKKETETSSSASSASTESTSSSSSSSQTESTSSSSMTEDEIYDSLYDPILDLPLIEGEYTLADCLKLGDYKKMDLTRTKAEVTDEQVDEELSYMVPLEEVTDPNATVENGDTVNLDYAGTVDGEAFEGGTAEGAELVIGSNSFIEGFEAGMVGMKKGEERDLDLKFPENYWSEELAGKATVFHVKVNSIQRPAELTDAWVQENTDGKYKTVAEYREYIREHLAEETQASIDSELQQQVWESVKDSTTFHGLPKVLVDKGEEVFRNYHKSAAESNEMTIDEYLEASGVSQYEFDLMAEINARLYAQEWILTEALAEAEGVTKDSPIYLEKLEEFMSYYGMSEEEIKEVYGDDSLESYALTNAVIAKLIEYIPEG